MDEDVKKEFKAVYKRMLTQGNNVSKMIGVEKDLLTKIKRLEWYCVALDHEQDQIYKLLIEQEESKKANRQQHLQELIKKREGRDKAFAIFGEKSNPKR